MLTKALQVWQTTSARNNPCWKGSPVVAGAGMLPLRRDADMCQGEERRPWPVCGRLLEAEDDQVYSKGVDPYQEAP